MSFLRFTVAVLACLGALSVPASVSADPYVAVGDSLTAFDGFSGLLYSEFQAELGADEFLNRAQPGATSGWIMGSQLATALADINSATDTKAVTAGVGGNDALTGACDSNYHLPACPFQSNFGFILDQLQAALATDPGTEKFAVLAYYNPKNAMPDQAVFDNRLFGANGQVGLTDTGTDLGLNDVIYQEATDRGIPVADPSAEFKAQGQGFISGDGIHPNAAGYKVIAQKFCEVLALECVGLDSTPPDTVINTGPTGTITTNQATFTFAGNPAGDTDKVQCRIDSAAFADCSSPKTFSGLADGPHTVEFRAQDAAGNQDPTPATRAFTVDTTVHKAKIGKVRVSGPKKAERGKRATYKVEVTNSGKAEATGVRLNVSGRGVSFNTLVGVIQGGSTRTVSVKVKPKKTGKIKATFKVTSSNAGSKTVRKTITVRK